MDNIPWQAPVAFQETFFFLRTMDAVRPGAFDGTRQLASQISRLLTGMDRGMDQICGRTCPECRDNCCARATIWYDFRDLLFLYFSGQPLPDRQIEKQSKGPSRVCMHLTPEGCALPRLQRPFVCTWYLCPRQKAVPGSYPVQDIVDRIKSLRREMESLFCTHCL